MISSSSSLLVFWVFSSVSLPPTETWITFLLFVIIEERKSYIPASQVPSWAALCTLQQQTKPYCLLLLQSWFESAKSESENGITAFRTHLVSQGHGVGKNWAFQCSCRKHQGEVSWGSFLSAQLSMLATSSWQGFHLSSCWQFCKVHLACYLF